MVSAKHALSNWLLGSVSQKSRKQFRPKKLLIKPQAARSIKLVFSEVVKGIKMKITAKLHSSRHLPFEDTKIIMSPEVSPKSFGAFDKQVSGVLALTTVFSLGLRLLC